ncbi:MAG: FmdB family zinc ribbon protein [Acidimicrobiales bacterium]
MPTYEYQCKGCGRAFEAVQAFSDSPLTTCEVCGGALKKVYGTVGIVFKGSGFYKTDNRPSGSSTKKSEQATTSTNGHDAPARSESSAIAPSTSSGGESSTPSKEKDTAKTK